MPVEKDWDLLIHRYLEGTLAEDEAVRFNEGVRSDPRVRRRLAEMAFDDAGLGDLLDKTEAPAPADPQPAAPRSNLLAVAVVALTFTAGILTWSLRQPGESPAPPESAAPRPLPAAMEILGTVTFRDEGSVTIRIDAGPHAGQTIRVRPAIGGDEGGINRRHREFLRRLRVGREVTLSVRKQGDAYVPDRLPREERKGDGDRERERPSRPDPEKREKE